MSWKENQKSIQFQLRLDVNSRVLVVASSSLNCLSICVYVYQAHLLTFLHEFVGYAFQCAILIGLFSCQGVGWCKELTLSNNRVLHEFFTSNAHWTLLAAVVLHFGGMLFLFIAM